MEDSSESNAPLPQPRRPPVPLPRKSVPRRGSKQSLKSNESVEETSKSQRDVKTKGAYAKIKSILGRGDSDKPKLPPRPSEASHSTKKSSAREGQNYGIIPQSRSNRVHKRNENDISRPNSHSNERVLRESRERILGPRVFPAGSRTSPTGAVPRQTSREGEPASAQERSGQEVSNKSTHLQRVHITSKTKLLEVSQKALEMSIRADLDVENSKYLEAAKKYQECLDDIDLVLETPLQKLKLSQRDKIEAEEAVQETKRLRKHVLQGFSDAQAAYCLPQSMVDIPAEAPPSYNDVLMEDLLENNNEVPGEPSILHPISITVPAENNPAEVSTLIDLVSAEESSTIDGLGHQANVEQKEDVPEASVKPKVKTRFPSDVVVPPQQKASFLADRASKCMSCDSIPDSDFVTARSTPVISPFKQTGTAYPQAADLILKDVHDHLNAQNFIVEDPFLKENPFFVKFESNLNSDHSDVFKEIKFDLSEEKSSPEVSFFSDSTVKPPVVCSSSNPFAKDLESASDKNTTKIPRDKSDLFGELAYEVRKQFGDINVQDSSVLETKTEPTTPQPVTPESVKPQPVTPQIVTPQPVTPQPVTPQPVTPQSITRTVNKKVVTVQSPLGLKALNEIEGTDSKSSEDHFTKRKKQAQSVMNISESVEKENRLPNRHPLTRLKKMSRSNESLLQMFDPIKASPDPSYFADRDSSAEVPQNEPWNIVTFDDKENKDEVRMARNTVGKSLIDISTDTIEPETNLQSREFPELESSGTIENNNSLYPKLSGIDVRVGIEQTSNSTNGSSNSVAEELSISTTASNSVEASGTEDFDPGVAMRKDNQAAKKARPPKPARKNVDPGNHKRHGKRKSGVTIGRSEFYAKEAQANLDHNDELDVWTPVFCVQEAIKLFFLKNSSVSSPFNRQTIELLKKPSRLGGSRSSEGKVRLEVGGPLFARELEDKNTRVLLDEQGAYIVEASEGEFVCLVLTSKVDKAKIQEMERMFEIYTNLAKEPRGFNLGNNNVDYAARNALKAVQKKMPGIVKTHSMRAMKKIRGAIGKEEVRQELSKEFIPLRDASLVFREARMNKTVTFF